MKKDAQDITGPFEIANDWPEGATISVHRSDGAKPPDRIIEIETWDPIKNAIPANTTVLPDYVLRESTVPPSLESVLTSLEHTLGDTTMRVVPPPKQDEEIPDMTEELGNDLVLEEDEKIPDMTEEFEADFELKEERPDIGAMIEFCLNLPD